MYNVVIDKFYTVKVQLVKCFVNCLNINIILNVMIIPFKVILVNFYLRKCIA